MSDQFKQADFIKSFRADNPDLADIPDQVLMSHLFAISPQLKDQIITPDMEAATAQKNALQKANKDTSFTRAVLSSLPGIGGVVGSALTGPETGGTGILLGAPLGYGAGKGLQDLIEHLLGLSETTPLQKGMNITKSVGEAGITNALLQGLSTGLQNPGLLKAAGRASLRTTGKLMNPRNWSPMLEELGSEEPVAGKIKFNLERPGNYKMGSPLSEEPEITQKFSKTSTSLDVPTPSNEPTYSKLEVKVPESMRTPSSTKTGSTAPEPTIGAQRLNRPNTRTSTTMVMQPKYNWKLALDENGNWIRVPKE